MIVGSSLMARLPHEALLPQIYNLGMRGYSALTGLALLDSLPTPPSIIFIEVNTLNISPNHNLVNSVADPIHYHLKSWLPALRVQFQPVNIYRSALVQLSTSPSNTNGLLDEATPPNNSRLFQEILAKKQSEMSDPPDEGTLITNLEFLKVKVESLQSKGVRCIFVEMPIDITLQNSVYQTVLRETFQSYFNPEIYLYLSPLKDQPVTTTDGTHLNSVEMKEVNRTLLEVFEQNKS